MNGNKQSVKNTLIKTKTLSYFFNIKIIFYGLTIFLVWPIIYVLTKYSQLSVWSTIISKGYYAPILDSLKLSLLAAIICNVLGITQATLGAYISTRLKKTMLTLAAITTTLPIIFAVSGWRLSFATEGIIFWLNNYLGVIEPRFIFSQNGLLLIFCYYNLPLCILLYGTVINNIPPAHYKISLQMGLSLIDHWKYIIKPAIRPILPTALLAVFYFCFQDFNITYLLGLRPNENTLSVLIWQSLVYEANLNTSAVLTIIYLLPGLLFFYLWHKFNITELRVDQPTVISFNNNNYGAQRIAGTILSIIIIIFLLLPIIQFLFSVATNVQSLLHSKLSASQIQLLTQATQNSFFICIGSAAIACAIAYLFMTQRVTTNKLYASLPWIIISLPQLAIALGLFIILTKLQLAYIYKSKLFYIVINGVIYFPIVSFIWQKNFQQGRHNYQRLIKSLNLKPWQIFWYIDRITLGLSLPLAFAIVASLAVSDLTIIKLFQPTFQTLATLQSELLQTYNFNAVNLVQLLLVALLIFNYSLPLTLRVKKKANIKNVNHQKINTTNNKRTRNL